MDCLVLFGTPEMGDRSSVLIYTSLLALRGVMHCFPIVDCFITRYAILLIAQYGYRNSLWNEKLGKVIDVHKEPLWNIRDFYIPKRDNDSTYREQAFFEAY